jgi:hypothetical protein
MHLYIFSIKNLNEMKIKMSNTFWTLIIMKVKRGEKQTVEQWNKTAEDFNRQTDHYSRSGDL